MQKRNVLNVSKWLIMTYNGPKRFKLPQVAIVICDTLRHTHTNTKHCIVDTFQYFVCIKSSPRLGLSHAVLSICSFIHIYFTIFPRTHGIFYNWNITPLIICCIVPPRSALPHVTPCVISDASFIGNMNTTPIKKVSIQP